MGVSADLCVRIGRLAVQSWERVVLISEVIMALTSPVKGKEESSANLTQQAAIRSAFYL